MRYIKFTKRQDSGWKQYPCYSGETSINLSMDICDFLTFGLVDYGEEFKVAFRIHKEDFDEALDFLKSQCPLYRSSSNSYRIYNIDSPYFSTMRSKCDAFFKGADAAEYLVTLYNREDKRIYLKGLNNNGFNIRDYLLEESSALAFSIDNGIIDLRIISAVHEGEII